MRLDARGVTGFCWPVSKQELTTVRDSMLRPIADLARGDDMDARLMRMLSLYFTGEVRMLYRLWAVDRRLSAAGHRFLGPAGDRLLPALQAKRAPKQHPLIDQLEAGLPLVRRPLRQWLTRARIGMRWNGFSPGAMRAWRPDRDIACIQDITLIHRHAQLVDEPVHYVKPQRWLCTSHTPEQNGSGVGGETLHAAMAVAEAGFEAGGEPLPGFLADYLRQFLADTSALVQMRMEALMARPDLPRRLWTGSGGGIWSRMLRHAVLRKGGEVTGHDHGSGLAHVMPLSTPLTELESCQVFTTFTPTHAAELQRNIRQDLMVQASPPKIVGLPVDDASRGSRKTRSGPRGAPKRVMYLSQCYLGERLHFYEMLSDPVQLDWQVRLFAELTSRGYTMVLKWHPECHTAVPSYFIGTPGVELLREPLEQVLDQCDVVLMDTSMSTVFRNVLVTDTPLVLIDLQREIWTDKSRELIGSRAPLVKGWFDETNRVCVDWDQLQAAIEAAVELTDPTFFDTYWAC